MIWQGTSKLKAFKSTPKDTMFAVLNPLHLDLYWKYAECKNKKIAIWLSKLTRRTSAEFSTLLGVKQ